MEPTFIEPWEMRRLFNCGGYWKRLKTGQLTAKVMKSRKAPAASEQPDNTKSEMVWYFDRDQSLVAKVHQYTLPNGKLGGSGYPDPKVILKNGSLFHCYPPSDPPHILRKCWASINAVLATICRLIIR